MNLNLFFAMLGGLLVLAFIANRLVRFTGVPDVIILMFTGVLIGPVLHWVDPEVFRGATHGFGSLALMLILFEGGLDLKLREILNHFAGGLFLALVSYVFASASVALLCRHALQFAWVPALLVGAVLGCISSSILLPVLQQVNLRREVKVTQRARDYGVVCSARADHRGSGNRCPGGPRRSIRIPALTGVRGDFAQQPRPFDRHLSRSRHRFYRYTLGGLPDSRGGSESGRLNAISPPSENERACGEACE